MALAVAFAATCGIAGPAACKSAAPVGPSPAARVDEPSETVFFTREVRGDRDGQAELAALARPLLEAFRAALRLAGAAGAGRGEVAGELSVFDLEREPRELVVSIDWLDAPAAEGVRVTLRRDSRAGRAASLALTLVDRFAPELRLDGRPEQARFAFAREARLDEVGLVREDRGAVIALRAGDTRTRVISSEVDGLLDQVERDLYRPRTGDGYASGVRASTRRPLARTAAPAGTSFPEPPSP